MVDHGILQAPPLGEFRYFPLLPKELRDIIWEYAALPFVPGIHFFKLQMILDRPTAVPPRAYTKAVLSVPDESGFIDGLGFSSNASSYFNDLGVWDACCESRQILETLSSRGRIAQHGSGPVLAVRNILQEQNMPYTALDGWARGACDEMKEEKTTCQCSYGSHSPDLLRDKRRDVFVNLEQDVICLTLDLHNLVFERDGSELLDIPELRALKDDFPVRKLALQYHPEWAGGLDGIDSTQEDCLRDVLDMFGTYSNLPLLECVYFIDYRITPRRALDTRPAHSGGVVFRGRGRSFYEVRRDDDSWALGDDRPFVLAEELAESRSLSRSWSSNSSDSEYGEGGDTGGVGNPNAQEQGTKTLKLIEDWAEKWGLDQNQECAFKVLACVDHS